MQTNERQELALKFVEYTGANIFLTGKAGTGKTTFLRRLRDSSAKRMIVVAPTGVAAINAGGVTIHSFFQIKPGLFVHGEKTPKQDFNMARDKVAIIRSLDLLVIDEISMVRADLLDAIDDVLRRYRGRSRPFGGVQLLMIGDLQQLAPVVRDEEWDILRERYISPYFFDSIALKQTSYTSIELDHIYRQSNKQFIDVLNMVREGKLDKPTLDILNSRYIKDFRTSNGDGYITLTTHNSKARAINEKKLEEIKSKTYKYKALIDGNFYERPCDEVLQLKKDAQVMFAKNDSSLEKRYYNGKIGRVVDIGDDFIEVLCDGDEDVITVEPEQWENTRYSINNLTGEITANVEGRFTQYPLRTAWAITIHKSQGLTFEKAVIDAGSSFAHGQVYVALSRCRTMEGVVLTEPLDERVVIPNTLINDFTNDITNNPPTDGHLEHERRNYYITLLQEQFDFSDLHRRVVRLRELYASAVSNIYPDYVKRMVDLDSKVLEMVTVGGRFGAQLRNMVENTQDYTNDKGISERVVKGCQYFSGIIEEYVIAILRDKAVEIDNKESLKSINDAIKLFKTELYKKVVTINYTLKGFTVEGYVKCKAMSALDKPRFNNASEQQVEYDTSNNPLLFERLRSWRRRVADSLGVPAYIVASQKVIVSISNTLPSSDRDLKKIKGVGSKFLSKYGTAVMDIVADYAASSGVTLNIMSSDAEVIAKKPKREKALKAPKAPKPKKVKADKVYSRKVSYDMYLGGKSLSSIAIERELTLLTIESHLCYYVSTGELEVSKLVSQEVLSIINNFINGSDDISLRAVKDALGDMVSYSDIKFVLAAHK